MQAEPSSAIDPREHQSDLPYTLHTVFIVESAEKGKHLTRNFWPARGICIEGS
eukprot:COSAG05_NODE_24271_length_252_cov_1.248366_1_plen_52_part_10